jgi:hypothetical protein
MLLVAARRISMSVAADPQLIAKTHAAMFDTWFPQDELPGGGAGIVGHEAAA